MVYSVNRSQWTEREQFSEVNRYTFMLVTALSWITYTGGCARMYIIACVCEFVYEFLHINHKINASILAAAAAAAASSNNNDDDDGDGDDDWWW